MNSLTLLLFTITEALLAPVVLALLALAAISLLYFGGLIREWFSRRRGHTQRSIAIQQADSIDIDQWQLRAERALLPQKLCARLGPMLGLAGTLIPLGPALQAFAAGNTSSLSNHLVIAFATTVVGLLVGGLSYCCYTIRRQWYTEDLHDARSSQ